MSEITQAERERRWATCIRYLRLYDSIEAAEMMAERDGIEIPHGTWLTAFSRMLMIPAGNRPDSTDT